MGGSRSAVKARVEVRRDDLLGEEVHTARLGSGLRVVVHMKPGFQKRFAVLAANFGSVDRTFIDRATGKELEVPDGIAHFLEHKLFELKDGDAFAVFSRQGASANAATSFRNTSFFFNCSARFDQNLRTLMRFVGRPHITERAVEKERGIIAQEIRMYEDSADWRCFMNLVQGIFHHHPVRTDITGTVESIGRIDRATLLTCYRNFYRPENLCLVVSGDVDPGDVVRIAERELNGAPGTPGASRLVEKEPQSVVRRMKEEVGGVQLPKFALGFKDRAVPIEGAALQRRDLLTGVLLSLMFGSSSKRWQALYERGVIDDSFYTSYAGEEDFGFVTLGGESDCPESTRTALLSEIRRSGREGFSTEDFGRVVHKTMGRFVRGLDSQESAAFLWMSSTFRDVDPFRIPTMLRRIGLDDVMERHAELFGERNHSTSIVRPGR